MIEIVWGLICLAGILMALWGYGDASADLRTLGEDEYSLRVIARGYRRAEVVRFGVHVILLGISVPAMVNPAPVALSPFVSGLIAVNLLLLLNSTLDARDRLYVRRMART